MGGGFGGVKAALELSKRQIGKVTLISEHDFFLHHATLYATATGGDEFESVIPLKHIFARHPSVHIVQDTIHSLDPHKKTITGAHATYAYDTLVLALGAVTTFFGIEGMAKHAFGIKTLDEVREFQEHINDEVAAGHIDKEIFVIGGGQTGIELASALHTYTKKLKISHRLKGATPKVVLVEASGRIAGRMSPTASTKISRELRRQGIRIVTNHSVQRLRGNDILIEDKAYPTTTAVWTSGVANNQFFADHAEHFTLAPNGRVIVNKYLEARPHVYVIGDNNTVKYSGTSVPALQQGAHVAKNITRLATRQPQKVFRPHSVPSGVPVGEKWAYVEWFGIYAAGRTGAFIRRLMELYGYCQLLPRKEAFAIWKTRSNNANSTIE